MRYIVHNIKGSLDFSDASLKKEAAKAAGINVTDLKSFRIVKQSVDARKKSNIHFVFSVCFDVDGKKIKESSNVKKLDKTQGEKLKQGNIKLNCRPVIVGFGPAGMFAGLFLAQKGYNPIILERGECVEKRSEQVNSFWTGGDLNLDSNVQFGEGGAGTFSDGKLTTRINDHRCDLVLEELYKNGAPEEILYKAKPHIGTDVLKTVVRNVRENIIKLGGQVRFNSRVDDIDIDHGKIKGLRLSDGEYIDTSVVIIAIGHSARDTFQMLTTKGVVLIPKAFSVGVRIEHLQETIDQAQFGEIAGHKALHAAEYQLFKKIGARTAYTFCMCPGGTVVAAASEKDTVVTNGMSEFARDGKNANSAFVVSVEPSDFQGNGPLAGMEFQRQIERLSFKAGGGNYAAPVQLLGDFLDGRASNTFGTVKPTYTGETQFSEVDQCLPSFVTGTMREAMSHFDRMIPGFAAREAVLTASETRTSSPVRITRDDNFEAVGITGLYPSGEGAGYAGGIMSAAVDGLRVAEAIYTKYLPK